MVAEAEKVNRRTLAKARRRQQLIDATIKCISKKGLGGTTLADVAREAGLSQGIVNLHFDSKDNLLVETLRYLAEDYDSHFMRTLEESPPDPGARLLAIMEMELKPPVCDRKKLAVWFAFWGEVQAVPTYRKIYAARDHKYDDAMRQLCADVIRDGNYRNIDADIAADALSSMGYGMWLTCLVNPKTFDRNQALDAVKSYLCAVFPDHYPQRAMVK